MDGKGIKPEARALGYIINLANGNEVFCSVAAFETDPRGHFRAWVHHPQFGLEIMTPKEGRLDNARAIIALTTDDYPEIIEKVREAMGTPAGAPASEDTLRARVDELEGGLIKANRTIALLVARIDAMAKEPGKKAGKTATPTLGPTADPAPSSPTPPEAPKAEETKAEAMDDLSFLDPE
jgi:hypothetical protein